MFPNNETKLMEYLYILFQVDYNLLFRCEPIPSVRTIRTSHPLYQDSETALPYIAEQIITVQHLLVIHFIVGLPLNSLCQTNHAYICGLMVASYL